MLFPNRGADELIRELSTTPVPDHNFPRIVNFSQLLGVISPAFANHGLVSVATTVALQVSVETESRNKQSHGEHKYCCGAHLKNMNEATTKPGFGDFCIDGQSNVTERLGIGVEEYRWASGE